MPIPRYTDILHPMLVLLGDEKIHKVSELVNTLADSLSLSEDDRNQMLPGGTERTFKNRVWWARTFLFKAELIHSPMRGFVQISSSGKKALEENAVITLEYLRSLPHFEGNWGTRRAENGPVDTSSSEGRLTPEELMSEGHKQLQDELVRDILVQVRENVSPSDFEQLVIDLLVRMGYGGSRKEAGIAVGRSGDGGIDGLINEDRLGLSKIYIQAKHWQANVGDVEIGRFLGSLASRGATKGVFITTSDYTAQAKQTILNNRSSVEIVLIDGAMLADLMIEHGLGVTTVTSYEVRRIDSDYFI